MQRRVIGWPSEPDAEGQEDKDAARVKSPNGKRNSNARWRLAALPGHDSGTILKKNAGGNLVNAIAFSARSALRRREPADLEVDLSIQERDIKQIFVGQRCTVRAEAYTDRVYKGVVARLMPIADKAKARPRPV